MILKYKKNLPGFSLMEIIVILIIISVAMIGVLNLMLSSLRTQSASRETLIAYNLAQEGIDLVRNVRDSNVIHGDAWNMDIVGDVDGNNYKVDFRHFIPVPVIDISGATLQIASSTNQFFYIHDASSTDSIFRRMITITADSETAPSSTVTCVVEWNDRGDTRRFEAQTELYDWK